MARQVCSTTSLFHYFFDPSPNAIAGVLRDGLRPLSDFPDSERWQQIEAAMPGFFQGLYTQIAQPILQKPYANSGIFLTPIDFYLMDGMLLSDKSRIRVPASRIAADGAVVTYVLDGERVTAGFTAEALAQVADIWHEDLVREWFAKDMSKVFFYIPQIATYRAGGIKVEERDLEYPKG